MNDKNVWYWFECYEFLANCWIARIKRASFFNAMFFHETVVADWTLTEFGIISRMYAELSFRSFNSLHSEQIHVDVVICWNILVKGWMVLKASSQSSSHFWIKQRSISWTSFWDWEESLSKAAAILANLRRYSFVRLIIVISSPTRALKEVFDWEL